MASDKNFKIIEIPYSLNNGGKSKLKLLLNKFNKNDFNIETNEIKTVFYVFRLDLQKLKAYLRDLELIKNNVFVCFLEKLENIKSYGIDAGKRVYVNYNSDRKVKQKTKKTKQRGGYEFYRTEYSKNDNDLPEKYTNNIFCEDSEKFLKKLPDNCIDMIFTSPPYNFGLDYENSEDDSIKWKKYFEKLFEIFKECIRVLKYSGRIAINIQPLFSDYIPSHHIISNFFMQNGLIWKGEILWEKNNYNCKYTAWGSWKSPSSPYLKYTWEFIEIFCKGSLKKKGDKNNIDITAEEFKQFVTAKWSIAPESKMKEFGHPAMFPEKLVYRMLKLFSYQNDIILDPFNGVGTTTAIAKKLNRKYIGIDNSKDYCKKSEDRLNSILI